MLAPGSLLIVAIVLSASPRDERPGTRQNVVARPARLPPLALEGVPAAVRADIEAAHAVARSSPTDAQAVGRLATLLHTYGQHRLADACYRVARQLDATSFSWTYLSAIVQSEIGESAAAIDSFRDALRLDATYLPARLRLAETLMKAGKTQESRRDYETLVRELPDFALAHYGLGRLLTTLGDRAEAANHYRRAVELVPQFGAAHYALALAYRGLGQGDRAQPHFDAYQRFGQHRPALPDPVLERVESLKHSARDLIAEAARVGAAGKLDESISLHLQALESDPSVSQAHVNLISLYGRKGRREEAEAHYRAAVALGANLAEAHYNYGVLLAATGRNDEAADAFRKALAANPFHAQAHYNLGGLLARQGKLEDAIAEYRQSIANDPQHRPSRFNLARALVAAGRPAEAIDQLQRILTPEDAETPRYRYALASTHLQTGNVELAREYAERALRDAERLGQRDLAAAIQRTLARMPMPEPK